MSTKNAPAPWEIVLRTVLIRGRIINNSLFSLPFMNLYISTLFCCSPPNSNWGLPETDILKNERIDGAFSSSAQLIIRAVLEFDNNLKR